jgi:ATP-dependent Lon protease
MSNNNSNQPNQPNSFNNFNNPNKDNWKNFSKSSSGKSKYQIKKYKNRNKNKRLIQMQINEELSIYNESKLKNQDFVNTNNFQKITVKEAENEDIENPYPLKRTISSQSNISKNLNSPKGLNSPVKLIRVNSLKEEKIKEFKDNIRKSSSLNLLEGLINGLNNNFYQTLSKDDDDLEEKDTILVEPKIPKNKSRTIITDNFELEGIDIEDIKSIPIIISVDNDNPSHTKQNNKKKNKKNDNNSTNSTNITNTLNSEFNIKNIEDIKDLDKKMNDVSDYNLIHTPFKMIGEELLNDEISVKYKTKNKNSNESQVIIKKLKENFRKMVVNDIKDKPNLSKILLDSTLSEDVKLKILRKFIRYSTEDEVFSESADKIRLEINNLLKIKKLKSSNDYDEIWDQIENKEMPEKLKSKLEDMYYRIITGDENKLTNYVHNILRLPYHRVPNILDEISKPDTPRETQIQFIKSIYTKLDENLFGLSEVKDSIVSYICQRINNPEIGTSKYLCLCGPAGVGKTSIVHAISEALQIPYSYLSLANVDVPSTLIGHDYTYEGSTHGCIADAVIKNGCANGIVLFDELDKCKEKIHNTLLGIFDPLQNCKFRDAYFGNFHLDLSQNMMIICLNDLEKINPILRDRLHIINIPGYSADEKRTIVRKYIIPKLEVQYKIDIKIEPEVIDYIITNTSQHKGIRQLIMYLTKIYELAVLDKFTCKFNFGDKFKLKDLTNIKFSDSNEKPIMSMYV